MHDNVKSFDSFVDDGIYRRFGGIVGDNRFSLAYAVYEALEDPDDGYRSYLGSVSRPYIPADFWPRPSDLPDVKVVRVLTHMEDTYHLRDKEGHTWLVFGTDMSDRYYPCFIFRYTPKAPPEENTLCQSRSCRP